MSLGQIGNDIPKNWKSPLLVDLISPKQWKTIPTKNLTENGYVVYGANGKIGFYSEYTHEKPTLMITCRGATCGNLHISEAFSYINGNAMALDSQPIESVGLGFLFYALQARGLQDTISGSAQPQITGKGLQEVRVPLPPLAEQKAITAKLDTLLTQVTTTKSRLEHTLETLKQFRQSVLADAVSGKLTQIGNFKSEPLSELINEMRNGLSPKPNEDGLGYPILRISSVRAMGVDTSDIRYLECNESTRDRYALIKNDLLFTRYNGSLDFVGVCGLFQGYKHETLLYPDKLIRVRTNTSKLLPKYTEIYFSSPEIRTLVTNFVKSTSGQKGISGKDLKSVAVKYPTINEQKEIVSRVEKLFAGADATEQQVNQALERVNNLTQSILAKAFRGELTEQWRNDNPELISGDNSAKALLEKIKAQRAATKPTRNARNKA